MMTNAGTAAGLEAIWNELAETPPSPGKVEALPCLPADPASPLSAGLLNAPDGGLRRVLLLTLPIRFRSQVAPDHRYAGLSLEPLQDPDEPEKNFLLALILTDERFSDIFSILAADIVAALSEAHDSNAQRRSFMARLNRWQELFGLFNPSGLSGPARQGLFGELHLIRELLAEGVAPGLVINAWTGPLHDPQDFHFGPNAVEVKTSSGGSQSFQVSGAAQLDESPFDHLFLLHLFLEVAENAGETLPQMVQHLAAQTESDPAALKLLETRLQQAGYFHAQADLYHSEGFRIRHTMPVQVNGDFPRIRAADLLAGVGSVSYTVETEQLLPYLIPFTTLTATLTSHV
ncbi:PD-(D/E)XK motif protein [Hymenobacter edaphi]|uniref:PD-(D/E)XK motif protein n=1 Tax=Hymenobacter edaphi TaxID=2211146 RepID=A0A328B5J5_9BACT|nr:PD-(D/E)XK motif protein [Hymenobacter edaphi]RAK62413.1 hypothetical protein DLM85_23715 [Hymenobacter edaphi]